jgi:hypothetical protein
MIDLLITLLRILFPLDPVARLREITRDYINAIVSCLEDPIRREAIRNTPHLCAKLDADIAALEHGIHLLIHERARQILGLPYIYTPRIASPEPRRARPLTQIIARLGRMAALFHNLERLAQRRADTHEARAGREPPPSRCFASIHLPRALRGGGKPPAPFLLQRFALGEVDRRVFAPRRRGPSGPRRGRRPRSGR